MASILLVEDSEMVRFALSALLRDSGHDVTEAGHGKRAERALAEDRFDLVVTDVFMPEMDGIELIKRVRSSHPEVKVLALSGGGARQPPKYAIGLAASLGAHATMQKPVDNEAFLTQIDALVGPRGG